MVHGSVLSSGFFQVLCFRPTSQKHAYTVCKLAVLDCRYECERVCGVLSCDELVPRTPIFPPRHPVFLG